MGFGVVFDHERVQEEITTFMLIQIQLVFHIYIVLEHVNYIRNLIGVDYIGIGGDYNGVSEMPEGLENVSKYPNLFAVLLEQNWTEEDLGKIASGNILRVWKKVEEVKGPVSHRLFCSFVGVVRVGFLR